MTIDAAWLFGFFCVFTRASALFLVAPIFGAQTPPRVRILFATILALALTPALVGHLPKVPGGMGELATTVGSEAAMGIILGMHIQLLLMAAQMAGSFLDMQLGLGNIQVFNPTIGSATTILGQFKFMLFLVVFFQLDGHHLVLQAFFQSYLVPTSLDVQHLDGLRDSLLRFVGTMSLLALQIAAPAAAVAVVIDAAAALVNKAIPQMQVFFVTAGVKSAVGIFALSLGLPLFAGMVQGAVTYTGGAMETSLLSLRR